MLNMIGIIHFGDTDIDDNNSKGYGDLSVPTANSTGNPAGTPCFDCGWLPL